MSFEKEDKMGVCSLTRPLLLRCSPTSQLPMVLFQQQSLEPEAESSTTSLETPLRKTNNVYQNEVLQDTRHSHVYFKKNSVYTGIA